MDHHHFVHSSVKNLHVFYLHTNVSSTVRAECVASFDILVDSTEHIMCTLFN